MTRSIIFLITAFGLFGCSHAPLPKKLKATHQKPFVVIVPSYNNQAFCEKNIRSILDQNYTNFRIIYIDDASTDATLQNIQNIVQSSPLKQLCTVIHNETNQGALKNLYTAVHSCTKNEIVVIVDGDDFLAHAEVLSRLNEAYADPDVWMTYGNFVDYPSYHQKPLICKPMPSRVVQNRSYRTAPWVSSHLRTFYAGLFQQIKPEDFLFRGTFMPMAADLATMIPMLEMAGPHCLFIDEVLYLYNRVNPMNDHKRDLKLQTACADHIRTLPHYSALEKPPYE